MQNKRECRHHLWKKDFPHKRYEHWPYKKKRTDVLLSLHYTFTHADNQRTTNRHFAQKQIIQKPEDECNKAGYFTL